MRLTQSQVHSSMFWILAVLTICNLNGVTQMLTGTSQIMSPLIFFSSIGCIITCRGGFNQYLEGPGKWFFGFFFAYLGLGILASFANDSKGLANGIAINLPTPFIVMAGAACSWTFIRNNRKDELFSGLFLISLVATLSIFFSKYLSRLFIIDYKVAYRASGFFREPNEGGMMACLCLMLAFVMLRQSKNRKLMFVLIGVIYLACFLTFSKTAAVSLIFLTLGQLLIIRGLKAELQINIVLLGIVLAGACYWIVSYGLDLVDWNIGQRKRIMEVNALMTQGEISEETTTGRTIIWKYAFNLILESPVIGWGLGTFSRMKGLGMGSHNTFLLILGESGIGPILLFLMFLSVMGATAIKCKDKLVRLFVLEFMLILMTASMSLHTILSRRFFTFFLGCCFGLLAGYRQIKQIQQRQSSKIVNEPEPSAVTVT